MIMTASHTIQFQGKEPAAMSDLQLMLVAGRLPDAPLSVPTQVLERSGNRPSLLRGFFFGRLGSAGT